MKKPFFPGFEWDAATGNWSTSDFTVTSARQENFLVYDNYSNGNYSITQDLLSPLYFLPSNCLKNNSVVINETNGKIESPVVAIVGQNTTIQD